MTLTAEARDDVALVVPPIPEGLCGISGCVFTKDHASRGNDLSTDQELHTWEVFRPIIRLTPDTP